MGTLGNPTIWVPYINPKDCSQGFCSLSCPQWCYLMFPPPPPLFSFPVDTSSSSSSSGPTFSPLVITIIRVLAVAFLLVSYYVILSKYCGNSKCSRRVEDHQSDPLDGEEEEEHDERENLNEHEAWVIRTVGLDEALIKSITLVKYKKGDGLVGSGDCSVCLGEFQEDESLRLLPKCSHAFHVECIDTWLRSHSNCPLCRATLFSTPAQPPNLVVDNTNNHHQPPQDNVPSTQTHVQNEEIRSCDQEGASRVNLPKCSSRVFSDLGLQGGVEGHIMRRSISMDHFHETRLSISDILRFDSKEATAGESSKFGNGDGVGGSSSRSFSNETSRNGVLNSVMNSMAMKRSFSSGRFLFTKHGRGRNAIIPL